MQKTKLFTFIVILLLVTSKLCAHSLTPQSTTFWMNLSGNLNLDHADSNPRVQKEIKYILADRAKFNQILVASKPYMPYIYNQTKARKLPAELALIPIIESEYDPNDRSTVGARGLWQLMPDTAKLFGMKVGGAADGRLNLDTSTNAALRYFSDLDTYYKGNWNLVFAAYNSGQGRVDQAIKKAGGTTNYYKLGSLPTETQIYVPKLMAVATILQNPAKYHITLPSMNT